MSTQLLLREKLNNTVFKRHLDIYRHQARILKQTNPHHYHIHQLVRYFPTWRERLKPGHTPLLDQSPWIVFAAIQFLERKTNKRMRVFEYGAGGSTLFFARRVREVVTVEHSDSWANDVRAEAARHGYTNYSLHVIPPEPDPLAHTHDPSDPHAALSSSPDYRGYTFKKYAASINAYPDGYFDMVLVDGRARPACFRHALPKVKHKGYIILDNTDRPTYQRAMHLAKDGFQLYDFAGPTPYVYHQFTRTSIWKKRTRA